MGKDHNCSQQKLNCCHSSEALMLILSRTPWRLSIKELSEITKYHRNTISPALKDLADQNKIEKHGSGHYYFGGIIEFYRRQAKAIQDLDYPGELKTKIARDLVYNLVKRTLKDALEDGPEFTHSTLHEALMHVKMAYPFSDIELDKFGVSFSTTIFEVSRRKDAQIINPQDFNLRIYACLCQGEKDATTSCNMVIGALEGAIEGACGTTANIEWFNSGRDDEKGSFCEYRIKSGIEIPYSIVENLK